MFNFNSFFVLGAIAFHLLLTNNFLSAQTELQAWGNITGIRVGGQMFRFESSLRIVPGDWNRERATARERNWTTYRRDGPAQIVRTRMDSLFFAETVRDIAPGKIQVKVEFDPCEDEEFVSAFFHLALPGRDFAGATIRQIDPAELNLSEHDPIPVGDNEIMRVKARGLDLRSANREITVSTDTALMIIVKFNPVTGDVGLYFTLQAARAKAGKKVNRLFEMAIAGRSDVAPAKIKLFPNYPGNVFLGLGGNFRLQNVRTDPQVIDYCLKNMDVRMGRVEMPWQFWHPVDTIDPLEAARRGEIHPRVKAAMEIAQRLYKMNMPVLLAAWFPPQWAAEGIVKRNPLNPDGTFGNPLRKDRMEEIYGSITGYILYLKEVYGVGISMFSFNESDLGINVRQTPKEHAALIKGLGAYMRSKGLNTKLLLGDTADANGFSFVNASLDDPETWEYIGAISFHSWRGWEKETLLEWYEAADRLNVPLIIGEGSIDAAAWRYPQIFTETHYALQEIRLYTRIMAICQPQTILQWQLTADYSLLKGGGVFRNDSIPLLPTQRFWNLKQLSHTPEGLHFLPLTCDKDDLFVSALGDEGRNSYAFHIVNEGGERKVILTGLPDQLKKLCLYVTDENRGMEKGEQLKVKNGEVQFRIGPACFVSLVSE